MKLRLSIREKMLLVCGVLLAIPWIGLRYAQELERVLHESQQQAVLNTALAIATALHDRPALFRTPAGPSPEGRAFELSATRLAQPIELDGRLDDWNRQGVELRALGREEVIERVEGEVVALIVLWHALGLYDRDLYAALEVNDDERVYRDPANPRADAADHVRIGLVTPWGETRRYVVSVTAPGPAAAMQVPTDAAAAWQAVVEPRISGYWRETQTGFVLELKLPRALVGARLGFAFADVDDATTRSIRSIVGTVGPEGSDQLGTALLPLPEATQIARSIAREGSRVWIVSTDHRLIARTGTLRPATAKPMLTPDYMGSSWLDRLESVLTPLYRVVLGPMPADSAEPEPDRIGYDGPELLSALGGKVASGRRALDGSDIAVIASAYPVWADERVLGAVVVESTTQAVSEVRRRLLERLLTLTLVVFLVTGIALFAFATRLSGRIRQLRDEAEQAIDSAGRLRPVHASSSAADEIGDLSRSFSSVLNRLAQHTQYLESLAARLSHELRTPIAVVRSSLDNLKMHPLPSEAEVYVGRAEHGLARLSTIITRMSEATRLERSMRQTERERFDLREVIAGCVEGYRVAYPQAHIELATPADPVQVTGVPDLIAQMLDKLVANAVDFSLPGAPIEVVLEGTLQHAVIRVGNAGPRLAPEVKERLFKSMVSARPPVGGDEPHLGLGLYIVQLIADFHHARVSARDRDDVEGVEFEVRLPRLIAEPA